MRRVQLVALLIIGFVLLPPSSGGAQTKAVWKAGHSTTVIYPYQIGLEKLNDEVKRRTNGQIEIQIFPQAQLGNERDLAEGVQLGTVDLIAISNAMVTNFVPEAVIFDLPYLFQDQDHALRAWLSPAGQRIAGQIEKKLGKILAYYGGGTRNVYNKARPITKPEDLRGLKIRVIPNKIYIGTLNAMGALATPLPFSEVYSALQQGVIDGGENDPTGHFGMKHYEPAKYYSLTMHFVQSAHAFLNWDRWNRLTPEQQKIVAEAGQISQAAARDYERAKYEESLGDLRRAGVQINDVDRAVFAERTKSVWQEVPSQYRGLSEEIQKVK